MPNDSPAKTVIVTLLVCLCASILVAGSAVLLRPAQIANKEAEQKKRVAELLEGVANAGERPGRVGLESRVVDLATGDYVAAIDAGKYDQRAAARDPAQSVAVPPDKDIALIKRRAKLALVYLARRNGRAELIVLPVYGKGFGSTLYGYLGLSGDARKVVGLTFYEHGETPGLGALIDDPAWRAQWRGKLVWDDGEELRLGVAQGRVPRDDPNAPYLVDGLTGATWTGKGVTNLLRYWLGDHGFGPYLRKIVRQGG